MKTNTMLTKVVAAFALALGTAFASSSALAETITSPDKACPDARSVSVKEAKWVPGLGRGMVIVDAGKALVCNSCATSATSARLTDRNSNGARMSGPVESVHDCSKSGCGGEIVAMAN